jgi:hypothetical protein
LCLHIPFSGSPRFRYIKRSYPPVLSSCHDTVFSTLSRNLINAPKPIKRQLNPFPSPQISPQSAMASSFVAPNDVEIVDLPNLPTELFNMVVHQLVATDIRGAWMMRGISKVFKNAVEADILRHQPSDVVRNSGEIIKQLMPRYLYWRIKKPNDVHTALLVRLTKMNDYLCEELHITSMRSARRTCKRSVVAT